MITQEGPHRSRHSRLMSIEDVAAYLRKPKSWVYGNWRNEGIPFKKIGNQLRCRPAELDRWFDEQTP